MKIGKYKVIEGFSGPGGMGLGLKNAGFDIITAFDNDIKSVETHNHNLGNKCFVEDARNIKGKTLLAEHNVEAGELDLFSGGPPCQGFSKQRKGAYLLGDNRNDLVIEYVRIVLEMEPRFFIFENVAIFGQKRGLTYLQEMQKKFNRYELYPNFYNAADYGLAQTRERFIIVGKRKDIKSNFHFPDPTVTKWKTVGEVLIGLPEPPLDYTEHPDFPNHQRAKVSAINTDRFSYVPQGGGWQDIPSEKRINSHNRVDTSKGGWPDVYGRLRLDGQCPTITGGFDSFTRGRFGHPLHDRPLTPREAARIQGFPDSFVFFGNRGDVRSQIGNAVPPPLAYAIGMQIVLSLQEDEQKLKKESRNSIQKRNLKSLELQ